MALKQLGVVGQEIFKARYAYPGEESWGERAKVMAKTMASCERDEDKESVFQKFYEVLGSGDFVPGGRIIFGAGRDRQNLLNCYVLGVEDNVGSIAKLLSDVYKISCGGGGIGFNFSKIRPKGDDISNIKNSSPGSISVMRMINSVGDQVRAGKNRRTALIAILNITHPDILEFLDVKLNKHELNNFNISVGITDRFIEAVENDEPWHFTFNNRRYNVYRLKRINNESTTYVDVIGLNAQDAVKRAEQHHKIGWTDQFEVESQVDIKAKDLWERIFKSSVECGDPGFFNLDLAKRHTNISTIQDLDCTNPCGEIPMGPYNNCCLGHINLPQMVLEDGSDVDWKRLANAVRTGVRFLDNVLTLNHYPLEECKAESFKVRRVGLGVMGLHYMLIKLGIKYGSDKCIEFLGRLFTTIRDEAYLTSVYIARDKSPFSAFDAKKYLNEEYAKTLPPRIRMLIKQHGIRNSVLLTCAPTGTIGMLMETSTGIEPIFAWAYMRRYRHANVWKEQVIVDPLFQEFHKKGMDLSVFVGAYDVTPDEHLKVQSEIQKYIDNSISKTINLPKETQWQDLSPVALQYMQYLKGMTIYRAGSKGNEPLSAIPLTEDNIQKYMKTEEVLVEVTDSAACGLNGGECGS